MGRFATTMSSASPMERRLRERSIAEGRTRRKAHPALGPEEGENHVTQETRRHVHTPLHHHHWSGTCQRPRLGWGRYGGESCPVEREFLGAACSQSVVRQGQCHGGSEGKVGSRERLCPRNRDC